MENQQANAFLYHLQDKLAKTGHRSSRQVPTTISTSCSWLVAHRRLFTNCHCRESCGPSERSREVCGFYFLLHSPFFDCCYSLTVPVHVGELVLVSVSTQIFFVFACPAPTARAWRLLMSQSMSITFIEEASCSLQLATAKSNQCFHQGK